MTNIQFKIGDFCAYFMSSGKISFTGVFKVSKIVKDQVYLESLQNKKHNVKMPQGDFQEALNEEIWKICTKEGLPM